MTEEVRLAATGRPKYRYAGQPDGFTQETSVATAPKDIKEFSGIPSLHAWNPSSSVGKCFVAWRTALHHYPGRWWGLVMAWVLVSSRWDSRSWSNSDGEWEDEESRRAWKWKGRGGVKQILHSHWHSRAPSKRYGGLLWFPKCGYLTPSSAVQRYVPPVEVPPQSLPSIHRPQTMDGVFSATNQSP